jgi:transposase InsO family protein
VSERYSFIGAEKACSGFPVRRGCMLLEVSPSGYYAWRERAASATAVRRAEVAVLAAGAHAASDGTNGYRRVHRDLLADGVSCSWQLVRRVLREQDLAGAQPAAYRVTTRQDPDAQAAPDLICRDFTSREPGAKLCGDITYIRTWAGWAYLAVVIDMATKMVVGWQISNRANAQLCIDALEMAHRNGHVQPDAIFHSDRGCQYSSGAFNACTRGLGVRRSMGRTGVCWDNAQAETFFASLKVECIYRTAIPTLDHARRTAGRYIEIFYNRRRRHSALGYQTPQQRYSQLTNQQAQAA